MTGRDSRPTKDPTIGRKGRLVEKIAAWLYDMDGMEVLQREYLPTLDGEDECEIDVLVRNDRAGYQVDSAIECKNEEKPVGKRQIEYFAKKLDRVGIPRNRGIYIAVSRYADDALTFANKNGIEPLLLRNLNKNRLESEVAEIFQSIVFLRAMMESVFMIDAQDGSATRPEEYGLYDPEGRYTGTFADHVWLGWLSGQIDGRLGDHLVDLQITEGWYRTINGEKCYIQKAGARMKVEGLVLTFPGIGKRHALERADTQTVERFGEEARFSPPEGTHQLKVLHSEAELDAHVAATSSRIVTVIKVPRIRVGSIYWPPSERVAGELRGWLEGTEPGKMPELISMTFDELEGPEVKTAWEPILSDYFSSSADQPAGD